MAFNARKGPLCNLRTTQAQISLRISTGWSGPSLSAYRINGYCSICLRTENGQIRLFGCACWSGSTLSASCIRPNFVLCASVGVLPKYSGTVSPFHACPQISTTPFLCLLMCLKTTCTKHLTLWVKNFQQKDILKQFSYFTAEMEMIENL